MTDTPPLVARSVVKRFDDVTAVDHVDLELPAGELLALVGPSGCGKSTLLRAIAGLHGIDSGTVHLDGRLVDDGGHRLPPERRSVGLVFQEHALFPHLTVADNIAFGLRDTDAPGRTARVREMLELVDLEGYGGRYPHELSGGERQRVALARALAPAPALMLFDEPFASLDHNLRVTLRQDVVRALKATGTPAVFVTHDQQEALAIGDRIAVMRSGRIRQLGSPAEVYHRPVDRFVGAFMGPASFLPISTEGHSALGRVELGGRRPSELVAMVRPDDVVFIASPDGPAEIVAAEYHGSGWQVTAHLDDGVELLFAAGHLVPPAIGERGDLAMTPGHRQVALSSEAD
ncbi:MAG: ABC transporter ATP-binding protein [Actinomycetota bacterium]